MKCVPLELDGVLLVEPRVHRDERGFFLETYHQDRYRQVGIDLDFVQDNHSASQAGTLRGLHTQRTKPQGKLVRALQGAIFDVAADVRRGSPTFGRWVGAHLSSDNFRQLYIPPGFAHGFCVLTDLAHIEYKCTALYDPDDEITIAWNDPDLDIAWPIADPILSARDAAAPALKTIERILPTYRADR